MQIAKDGVVACMVVFVWFVVMSLVVTFGVVDYGLPGKIIGLGSLAALVFLAVRLSRHGKAPASTRDTGAQDVPF